MSAMVRRGGRAILDDGIGIVWSVADGRRGRRWRAMASRDGQLVEALLLEVDNDGRPTRLELTTTAGLLTLHPEPSGGLHGNVVTPTGIRHLTFPWTADHELAIDRLPIGEAVTARRLASTTPVGEGREIKAVSVGQDLGVREGRHRFVRVTASTWRIDGDTDTREVTIDERGLPVWPGSRGEWLLELEPQP